MKYFHILYWFALWPGCLLKADVFHRKVHPIVIYSLHLTIHYLIFTWKGKWEGKKAQEQLLCHKLKRKHVIYIHLRKAWIKKKKQAPVLMQAHWDRKKKKPPCFLKNILQEYRIVWSSSQLYSFLPPSFSVSLYVIGATVELPLWFRWEQFEKIGCEKAQNNTYKSAKVHLVTSDCLCVPFLSLITCSEAVGLWAQEWSRTWFTVGQIVTGFRTTIYRKHSQPSSKTAQELF